ncbi:hypothetical protein [Actinophytocola oryzae]|uniref:Lipoprotein n=1 Tax=Actinophytocola oryzae TaxID=502181 RepID=A0A4R7VDJ3_9PSEU|nr:hypothetical protein [Actinophytocola oryzae]TDV47068.1 hypothetical protein CLV71_110251 [Actinophytocola oryzae]
MPWLVVLLCLLVSACGRPAADTEPASPCAAEFGRGEFGSDYAVVATLSHPPVVGETATLTVGACAKEPGDVIISVRLADGVEWRTPPDGTSVTTEPAPYGGCRATATRRWDLAAMTPVALTGVVVATKAGTAELTGTVEPAGDRVGQGNSAYVHLTVGADASHLGFPERSGDDSATTATPRPSPDCG